MVAGKPEMPEGSAVGAQLVGRHPSRREALFAEQLAHQLDGPKCSLLGSEGLTMALTRKGYPLSKR